MPEEDQTDQKFEEIVTTEAHKFVSETVSTLMDQATKNGQVAYDKPMRTVARLWKK